eukprot:54178-Rhodomonas_salina.1
MSAAPPKTEAVPPEIGALELEMEACLDGADVVEQEGFVQDRAVGFTETDTRAHVMARDGGRKTDRQHIWRGCQREKKGIASKDGGKASINGSAVSINGGRPARGVADADNRRPDSVVDHQTVPTLHSPSVPDIA